MFNYTPDIPNLCRKSSELIYPQIGFDDFVYQALVEVVWGMPDDRWGYSVRAIATLIFGRSKQYLDHFPSADWNISGAGVLEVLRSCRQPADGYDFVDRMSGPTVNSDWKATSEFLHIVNPKIFPFWSDKIARHFGVTTAAQRNSKAAYIGWLKFAHHTIERHDRILHGAVHQHILTYAPPIRALSLLLSWSKAADVKGSADRHGILSPSPIV